VGHDLDVWAAYTLAYGPGVTLENVTIEDCGTAIKAEGGVMRGRNLSSKGNRVGIDAGRSYIDMEGLANPVCRFL